MKPTLKQVQEWHVQAIEYANEATDQPLSWVNVANMKYAELVAQWGAAQEREACAKVCDAIQTSNEDRGQWLWEAKNCAEGIRKRSAT